MDGSLNLGVYHLFIDPLGQEVVLPIIEDFFREVRAKQIQDYPIWFFEGPEQEHDYFVDKVNGLLLPLCLRSNPSEHKRVWRIPLMGPHGHSGSSGLF